jgi:hypothetical protein
MGSGFRSVSVFVDVRFVAIVEMVLVLIALCLPFSVDRGTDN